MLSEEEKKAINRLKAIDETVEEYDGNILKADIEIIMDLITKLQKENEDLKREKEENKYIIAMSNNEMLGYNQGYSDAKNQNSNATEIIMKNRQDYIHKEEVKLLQKKIEKYKYLYQKSLDNTVKSDKENIDLKKQVDLMNEYLERISQDLNNISIDQIPIAIAELKYKNKLADNQIDLIIEEYEYNARINFKNFCEDELRKDSCIQDCKTCAKQYFEKLAKEKGE